MKTHSFSYYVKSAFIVSAIFCTTFQLSTEILNFSKTGDIFSVSPYYMLKIGVLILVTAYLYTLSIGAWDEWEQFAIIPIPTALGVTLSAEFSGLLHAPYIGIAFLAVLEIFIWNSTGLKKLFLKFSPTMIMKPTLNGMVFLFSILSGASLLLDTVPQITNIGNKIGTIIEAPLKQAVTKQIPAELRIFLLDGIDFKGLAEVQINNAIEPYKNYVKPIMAGLTFFLFQFIGSIALFVYGITINVLMWLATKTKIFRTERVEVQQETLKF